LFTRHRPPPQVACARAGVSLCDVEAHLDRRALKLKRRPGDAKAARIAAAAEALDDLRGAAGAPPTTDGPRE